MRLKLTTDEVADNGFDGGDVIPLSLDAKTGGGDAGVESYTGYGAEDGDVTPIFGDSYTAESGTC